MLFQLSLIVRIKSNRATLVHAVVQYRERYCTTACTNVARFDLIRTINESWNNIGQENDRQKYGLLLDCRSVQIIKQHVRHYLDADNQALFVDVELRRVDHRRDALLPVTDSEEVKESGNDFLVERKILGAHLRLWRENIL